MWEECKSTQQRPHSAALSGGRKIRQVEECQSIEIYSESGVLLGHTSRNCVQIMLRCMEEPLGVTTLFGEQYSSP